MRRMPYHQPDKGYPDTGRPGRYGYPGFHAQVFAHPYPGFDWTEADRLALYSSRKEAIRERDEALAAQKASQKDGNIDAARWYREEAACWLKRYRALCLIIGDAAFPDAPKDCPRRPMTQWPSELAPILDDIVLWRGAM